jgi:long-chain acyl-CoA synthetase
MMSKKSDSIAIMLRNIFQYSIALFATVRLGIIVVNVDPLYISHELIHQSNDAHVDTILFLDNFGDIVAEAIPKTLIKRAISTKLRDCLNFPSNIVVNFAMVYFKKVIPKFRIVNLMSSKKHSTAVINRASSMPKLATAIFHSYSLQATRQEWPGMQYLRTAI